MRMYVLFVVLLLSLEVRVSLTRHCMFTCSLILFATGHCAVLLDDPCNILNIGEVF